MLENTKDAKMIYASTLINRKKNKLNSVLSEEKK